MPQSYYQDPVTAVVLTSSAVSSTISADAHNGFFTITSSSANFVVHLPKNADVPVGWHSDGWMTATGCELRLNTADTAGTINGVDCVSTRFEAPIAATTLCRIYKVASATWIVENLDEGGDDITAPVPNA